MKSLVQKINEVKNVSFNFTSNMTNIEKDFTIKLSKLIGKNNNINISVEDVEIDFFPSDIDDQNVMVTLRSAAGILVENYLTKLLSQYINSEAYEFINDKFINELDDADYGTYENYDFEIGNIPFEIKTYSSNTNTGIYLTNSQRNNIGGDAFIVLVELGFSKNTIMIQNINVRQFKNLKLSGKYITGLKY